MRKIINSVNLQGRIYQHNLVIKTVQNTASKNNGKEYISGNLEIAIDEDGLNVITNHFTYVTEETSSGKKNPTYGVLKQIIDENKTWVTVGKENAAKVSVNSALALNEFYNQQDELVSTKICEGGFVSFISMLKREEERHNFTLDMLITGVEHIDADEERNITKPFTRIKGAVFNFRNELLPVELICKVPEGMKYFEGKEPTGAQPLFTQVKGLINCLTQTTTITEESAFGEAAVRTVERKVREWEITWTKHDEYEFGGEDLTADEITKAAGDREVKLAELKKRTEEYRAQKAAGTIGVTSVSAAAQKAATSIPAGGFTF